MDKIIWEIQTIEIEGTPEEKTAFAQMKREFLVTLRKEELEILKRLHDHAAKHFVHSIKVAHDVNYIARNIANFPHDTVIALTVAAILHDAGKLDIHEVILNLGDYEERLDIFKAANPDKPVPRGPLMDDITLNDIITFKSRKAKDPHRYVQGFREWLISRHEGHYLGRSLLTYIRTHQLATRKVLSRAGVSPRIIDYAAAHHPEYFTDIYKSSIPPECQVLAIADKFNAIIQSEGKREYADAETKITAIGILLSILSNEFRKKRLQLILNSSLRRSKEIAKVSIYLLAKKYLPQEYLRLMPRIEGFNRKIISIPSGTLPSEDLRAAEKNFIEINHAIDILKRFRLRDDFRSLIRQLQRQRQILVRKVPQLNKAA